MIRSKSITYSSKLVEVVPFCCEVATASPHKKCWHGPRHGWNRALAGIVYGRNIIQYENPHAMTRDLMATVHKDATLDDANELLNEPPSLALAVR